MADERTPAQRGTDDANKGFQPASTGPLSSDDANKYHNAFQLEQQRLAEERRKNGG